MVEPDHRREYSEAVRMRGTGTFHFKCAPIPGSTKWIVTCEEFPKFSLELNSNFDFSRKALQAMGAEL